MKARFPYLNFKSGGSLKQIQGFDAVVQGECTVAFGWDSNNPGLNTTPQWVTGDTRPNRPLGVELMTVSVAPTFESNSTEPFQLDAFSFYFNAAGPV